LRQIIPVQRCCAFCGEVTVFSEYLETPSYFQLNQARLAVFFEEEQSFSVMNCLSYLLGESLGKCFIESFQRSFAWVETQIVKPPPRQPVLALLPLYPQN
jgi:hypothetical protein